MNFGEFSGVLPVISTTAATYTAPVQPAQPSPLADAHPILNIHIDQHVKFQVNSVGANFPKWRQILTLLLTMYKCLDHITEGAASREPDDTWRAVDIHISLWFVATLSDDLYRLVYVPDDLACSTWHRLMPFFLDNQSSRYMFLSKALHTTPRGDQAISTYASKLQAIADDLAAIGRPTATSRSSSSTTSASGTSCSPRSSNPPSLCPPSPTLVRVSNSPKPTMPRINTTIASRSWPCTVVVVARAVAAAGRRTYQGSAPLQRQKSHPQLRPWQQRQQTGGGSLHQQPSTGGGRGRGHWQPDNRGSHNYHGRGGPGGASQTPWYGYFAPVGAPLPPARASWVPPNAAGVLGARPGVAHQVYPAMNTGEATTPPVHHHLLAPHAHHTTSQLATMSVSTGKSPAVLADGEQENGDVAAGRSSSCPRRLDRVAEEMMPEEARARREAEKAELEKKIASTKEEIVALEAALAEMDAAACGPEPTKA
uniref:Uncharacterized protein n=1 Tax=Avena sativa TaxID=4498 RepID=A0ACD5WYF2_AVESA